MNVFAFWIGDQNKIKKFKDSLSKQGLKLTIGPSKEEHDFLYKNFTFYKESFDRKIWPFCADVWRLYVLSKNEGIYIDMEDEIGSQFYKYFDDFKSYSGVFIRESSHTLASCFLYSTKASFHIFKSALNLYKNYDKGYFVRTFPLGPDIVTFINRGRYNPGFSDYVSQDNIAFLSPNIIRNKKRYFKKGNASWSVKKYDANKYWEHVQKNFNVDQKDVGKIFQRIYNSNSLPEVYFFGVRDEYDGAKEKAELKAIRNIYKSSKVKPFFSERLIWSKLYRFFTFKFLNINA